ncbi:hypothetical protein BZA77DRAFT_372740 [Pyronema omphalodes]|nr:hypothetical protein BZA77DRAFT_372740 [Pyronema omphalodes]
MAKGRIQKGRKSAGKNSTNASPSNKAGSQVNAAAKLTSTATPSSKPATTMVSSPAVTERDSPLSPVGSDSGKNDRSGDEDQNGGETNIQPVPKEIVTPQSGDPEIGARINALLSSILATAEVDSSEAKAKELERKGTEATPPVGPSANTPVISGVPLVTTGLTATFPTLGGAPVVPVVPVAPVTPVTPVIPKSRIPTFKGKQLPLVTPKEEPSSIPSHDPSIFELGALDDVNPSPRPSDTLQPEHRFNKNWPLIAKPLAPGSPRPGSQGPENPGRFVKGRVDVASSNITQATTTNSSANTGLSPNTAEATCATTPANTPPKKTPSRKSPPPAMPLIFDGALTDDQKAQITKMLKEEHAKLRLSKPVTAFDNNQGQAHHVTPEIAAVAAHSSATFVASGTSAPVASATPFLAHPAVATLPYGLPVGTHTQMMNPKGQVQQGNQGFPPSAGSVALPSVALPETQLAPAEYSPASTAPSSVLAAETSVAPGQLKQGSQGITPIVGVPAAADVAMGEAPTQGTPAPYNPFVNANAANLAYNPANPFLKNPPQSKAAISQEVSMGEHSTPIKQSPSLVSTPSPVDTTMINAPSSFAGSVFSQNPPPTTSPFARSAVGLSSAGSTTQKPTPKNVFEGMPGHNILSSIAPSPQGKSGNLPFGPAKPNTATPSKITDLPFGLTQPPGIEPSSTAVAVTSSVITRAAPAPAKAPTPPAVASPPKRIMNLSIGSGRPPQGPAQSKAAATASKTTPMVPTPTAVLSTSVSQPGNVAVNNIVTQAPSAPAQAVVAPAIASTVPIVPPTQTAHIKPSEFDLAKAVTAYSIPVATTTGSVPASTDMTSSMATMPPPLSAGLTETEAALLKRIAEFLGVSGETATVHPVENTAPKAVIQLQEPEQALGVAAQEEPKFLKSKALGYQEVRDDCLPLIKNPERKDETKKPLVFQEYLDKERVRKTPEAREKPKQPKKLLLASVGKTQPSLSPVTQKACPTPTLQAPSPAPTKQMPTPTPRRKTQKNRSRHGGVSSSSDSSPPPKISAPQEPFWNPKAETKKVAEERKELSTAPKTFVSKSVSAVYTERRLKGYSSEVATRPVQYARNMPADWSTPSAIACKAWIKASRRPKRPDDRMSGGTTVAKEPDSPQPTPAPPARDYGLRGGPLLYEDFAEVWAEEEAERAAKAEAEDGKAMHSGGYQNRRETVAQEGPSGPVSFDVGSTRVHCSTALLKYSVEHLDIQYSDLSGVETQRGKIAASPRLEMLKILAPMEGQSLDDPEIVDDYIHALREQYERIRISKTPVDPVGTQPADIKGSRNASQGTFDGALRKGVVIGAVTGAIGGAISAVVFAGFGGLYHKFFA